MLVANTFAFIWEIYANGWTFQPLSCPMVCPDGSPCDENGFPCEANPLLGPTVAVMDALGAKNDAAIFNNGEWWRVITCNFLHAGVLHLVFNMAAVWRVGMDLERMFGWWRILVLYSFSGLVGTLASILLLPGVLSVGASACVFGLVGACWADVIVNFCARYTLKNSGWLCLLFATILNVAIGFTPWVDNFMHLGGLLAGLTVGVAVFAKKRTDPRTGRRARTDCQNVLVVVAVLSLLVLGCVGVAALLLPDFRSSFRGCDWCFNLNCVATPLWSCCTTALPASCNALFPPAYAGGPITAHCNFTSAPSFAGTCTTADDRACVWPSASERYEAQQQQLAVLCKLICSGCGSPPVWF